MGTEKITDNILNKITRIYYGNNEINKIGEIVNEYIDNKKIKPSVESEMEKTLISNLEELAITTPIKEEQLPLETYYDVIHNDETYSSQISYWNSTWIKIQRLAMCFIIGGIIGWNLGILILDAIKVLKGTGSKFMFIYNICKTFMYVYIAFVIIKLIR